MSPQKRLLPLAPAAAVAALAFFSVLLPACSRHPARCGACEREIHPSVGATLALDSGRDVAVCCPRCALHYREQRGGVRGIRVSDYASGDPLPIEDAYLVEGSDETPCIHTPPLRGEIGTPLHLCYDRCQPSLIAFREAGAASAFLTEHGGLLRPPARLATEAPASH